MGVLGVIPKSEKTFIHCNTNTHPAERGDERTKDVETCIS